MFAFDTDVLTQLLFGHQPMLDRARMLSQSEQCVPVVVVEELLRGRLSIIRRAEAGKGNLSIERAYELFQQTFVDVTGIPILPYTAAADVLFQQWRGQKIRLATHDLRIAAICVSTKATLVSRNRRDFDRVPGLIVQYW